MVLLVMTSIWLLGSICKPLASPMEKASEQERGGEKDGTEAQEAKEKKTCFFMVKGHKNIVLVGA